MYEQHRTTYNWQQITSIWIETVIRICIAIVLIAHWQQYVNKPTVNRNIILCILLLLIKSIDILLCNASCELKQF